MQKYLLEGDSVIIDGIEITREEIKEALIDQRRYNKMSDFLRTTFKEDGVSNEQ